MTTTTSVLGLLKFIAGKQNSAIIDFDEFSEFLKRYSAHHLEGQPILVAFLSDTANALQKELDKLAEQKQVFLVPGVSNKKSIIFIPFLVEKLAARYKDMMQNPQIPFPLEAEIPKRIPAGVVTKRQAAEFINQFLETEELSDNYIYGIVLPNTTPTILMPSSVSVQKLIECALMKIHTMLLKEEHRDYFQKKLTVANPGREMTAKNFFTKFIRQPESALSMIKEPEDTFYFLTQLCFFIKKDYEKIKDYTQDDMSILQSIYIIEIAANYYKNKAQEKSKKENALKTLEQHLNKPPYYFSYEQISKFTTQAGIPLLGQYSVDELKKYLHEKSSESEMNKLPALLIFKTDDDERFFIFKQKVLPLILRLCTDARVTIRDTIKKHWFSVLKSFDELPEMKDQKYFEKRLEHEVQIQSPILYALLNASFLPLINYELSGNEDYAQGISLFKDGKLIPYSEILLMNRSELFSDSKILLPFWYSIPVISWIIKLIMRPPKSKRNVKHKNSSELYHEKEEEIRQKDKEEAHIARDTSLAKKIALREAARNIEAAIVPASSTIDREIASYEHLWNKLIRSESHKNLTEDVNSLIRDYMRKILRTLNAKNFTLERIQNLADTLVKTPGMQKIGEQDALLMYTQLYIIKLIKNIPT